MNDSNEPTLDHDRIIAAESDIRHLNKEMDTVRDWRHNAASPSIIIVQAQTKANTDAIASLIVNVDKLLSACGGFAGTQKALEIHQDDCITARREDVNHRDDFENWVRERFDSAKNRQLGLHAGLMLTMLGGMATMAWYIVTHIKV